MTTKPSNPGRRGLKILAIAIGVYLGIVVAFETLVVVLGSRQADRGLAPDEEWLVLTTTAAGERIDTVIAGVQSDGKLYVAANHWPRGWYERAIQNPSVEVSQAGETSPRPYLAQPVEGLERLRIAREYSLPFAIRLLTGFPPRAFLRLEPR